VPLFDDELGTSAVGADAARMRASTSALSWSSRYYRTDKADWKIRLLRRLLTTGRTRGSLRHAHAIELAREGVPLNVIQRQLGHRNLGVTSIYFQGIDPGEIIETVHARRPPMIPASAGLALPSVR
jgi:integrase